MKLRDRELATPMEGDDVKLLQTELSRLGFEIAEDERAHPRFGETTRQAVLDFQKREALPATGIVDEATAARIDVRVGKEEGTASGKPTPTPTPPSTTPPFVVRGRVQHPDGSPVSGVVVRAFDQDLPSLRADEQLGDATTDPDGMYEITYDSARFAKNEDDTADLVVRVYDPESTGKGARPLASSPTRFNAGSVETIDVDVDYRQYRGPSEYERLIARLKPLTGAVAIADFSREDIEFLAGETRLSIKHLEHLVTATRWAPETKVPPEGFYGLLRQGLPTSLPALVAEPADTLRRALRQSIGQNIISAQLSDSVDPLVDWLQQLQVRQVLGDPKDPVTGSVALLLGTALSSREQQEAFVSIALKHVSSGDPADKLWERVAADPGFTPADVDSLRFTAALSTITLDSIPLVTELQNRRKAGQLGSLQDLARLAPTDWESLVKASNPEGEPHIPKAVAGASLAERIRNYAAVLADAVEERFPTAVLKSRLEADAEFELPHKGDLLTFLQKHPTFEIGTTDIASYLTKGGDQAFESIADREGLSKQLEALQRVSHIAPRYQQLRPLMAAGFDSAFRITEESPETFVSHFAQRMGEENARSVYTAAEQKAGITTSLLTDLHPAQTATNMRVLRSVDWAAQDIPQLRTLFGSLDYCACEECRSILSPAAYLVDVLEFLRRRPARAAGTSARDVLFGRRPDLGEIELTCENTNTEVPYIDLVNELLENAVAPIVTREQWNRRSLTREQHELFQTRRPAEELKTYPEHLNAGAYARLRGAIYPWTLPFDLWAEEIRAYLELLGTSRAALIHAFRPSGAAAGPEALAIARETLALTGTAWDTIADTSSDNSRIWAAWGVEATTPLIEELSHVRAFLDRAGLTYGELIELLATRFINSDPERPALYIVPPTGCDLDVMDLVGLTDPMKGKIHRFVRLWRSLGWTMREVDLAIRTLGGGTLDAACLLRIADLKRVQNAISSSVAEVLSLWGPLDTDGAASLYEREFWNATQRSQFGDPSFDPARLAVAGDTPETIISHVRPILAALELTQEDLNALLEVRAGAGLGSDDVRLTLENLSFLYRHTELSRKLDLTIADLLALKTVSGIDPFDAANTLNTLRFVELARTVRGSGFSVDDLKLMFMVPLDSSSPLAPADEAIGRILSALRTGLHQVREEATVADDPSGGQVRRWLALLNWSPVVIDLLVRTLTNQAVAAPEYAAASGGRSTTAVTFARRALAAFAYVAPLSGFPASVRIPTDLTERLTYDADARTLRFAGAMTSDEQRRLRDLADDAGDPAAAEFRAAVDALFRAPDAASQPEELAFVSDAEITSLSNTATTPAERVARLAERTRPFLVRTLGMRTVVQSLVEPLGVEPEVLRRLLSSLVKSVAVADQAAIADFLDPAFAESNTEITITRRGPFTRAFKAYRLLHKVALVTAKFGVTGIELPWLFRPAADATSAEVNLNLLGRAGAAGASETFRMWPRLLALFKLRDRLGAGTLARIFELAQHAAPDRRAIERVLSDRVGWRVEDIAVLNATWRLDATAFRDERALSRLATACDLVTSLGVSAAQCWPWSEPDLTRAEAAREVAGAVRAAAAARYSTKQWTAVVTPLRDRLRERQAAALAAFLIAHTYRADGERTFSNTNDLYAYFLVDVEMTACRSMTRIKLAHSTVQLFVQRCLMNLELNPGHEVQALVDRDGDWRQWEWMKNYRVWEANRQVFLYPENVIEPELRDDKTEFFKDLESDLLKEDLTAETAENAFLNYLERLDAVGRLEICAMYRHAGTSSVLHMFARTRGTPHVYYYRRRITGDYGTSWTPWEQVDVDVEGDHLIPVVWNDRLYLFWPVFLEQTEQQPSRLPEPTHEFQEQPKYTQMQLAWSQRRHGKWTPKTVTKELAKLPLRSEIDLFFEALSTDGGDLVIRCTIRPRVLPVGAGDNIFRYRLLASSTTRRVEFRFIGVDGSVRRLPFENAARFVPLLWGTHLEGMTFVEDDPHFVTARATAGTALVFPNAPEGSADGIGDADLAGSFGLAAGGLVIPAVPAAAGGPRNGDHSLRVPMPVFGPRTILRRLPAGDNRPNRFRVMLPHNELDPVFEFFYQDNTRTFYAELTANLETARRIQSAARAPDPRPSEPFTLAFMPGLFLPGTAKYTFQAHYHPYGRLLMQQVNRHGIAGLQRRRVQTHPDELAVASAFDFAAAYGPDGAFVRDYPREEMDFSSGGAYAPYNWELFFHAPLLIAEKLSGNLRFEEAQQWFHAIFDPTDMSDAPVPQKYWRMKEFFERSGEEYQRQRIDNLLRRLARDEGDSDLSHQVQQWRENPFNPHLVARMRTTAFQRTVVMKYLDNLIAWADHVYRQGSLEAINEATQLYVLAADILGPRPRALERRAAPPPQTYYQLEPRLDEFGNALVRLENLTAAPRARRPLSEVVEAGILASGAGEDRAVAARKPAVIPRPKIKLPSDLYFCLLPNATLLGYWDKVADRLLKIRHCRDIEGGASQPSMFGERIDPEVLVRATALGVDLRSASSDLHAPLPQYRFPVLLQKASELCADVRGFGAALLSAWEKKDAEALARMRSGHELNLLDRVQEVKKQQVEDAKRGWEALQKSRELISSRRAYYAKAFNDFTNPGEKENLSLMGKGLQLQAKAALLELTANVLHIVPNTKIGVPTTMGLTFGGDNLGKALEAFAKYLGSQASLTGTTAAMTATLAGYQRRAEDWELQIQLADKELQQVDKQMAAAAIRVDLAQEEAALHTTQMRQARDVDVFMRSKFSTQELYDWMTRQLADVYLQSYGLAFDMARRAERAFRFERGVEESSYIKYGYWDRLHRGLMAGERLQLDLRRLEVAYLDQNRREHELTKHVSMALHDPFALHLLRTNGSCTVMLPESLFDRDHPGHYMRRIRSVALTLPAVVGPYTSVNCRLTLQSSAVRVSPSLREGEQRYRVAANAIGRDDRFRLDFGSVESIATSRAHSDTGLFELSFRDERYLPFEGAGAISTWQLELDPRCNDFDLATLSDVVMELHYTARDGGDALRQAALREVVDVRRSGPDARLFSARTEFPDAWNDFLYPVGNEPGQTLALDLDRSRFRFRAQQGQIELTELHVVLVLGELGHRHYPEVPGGGIRIVIGDPQGNTVNDEAAGLLLRVSRDAPVGAVPGGVQPLRPPVRVNQANGANSWRLTVPQAAIDALPAALRAAALPGQPARLAPEMVQDLLLFAIYETRR